MKFRMTILFFLCGLFVLSSSAEAYKISVGSNEIDVGNLDSYIKRANVDNSAAAELAWIKSELGDQYTVSSTFDVRDLNWIQSIESSSVYALDLNGSPEYFFVKLGTGGTSIGFDHWLYRNLNDFMYAVVNFTLWGEAKNINIGRVSHVGNINAVPVPEPSFMLTFGIGLVVIGVARRFKKT